MLRNPSLSLKPGVYVQWEGGDNVHNRRFNYAWWQKSGKQHLKINLYIAPIILMMINIKTKRLVPLREPALIVKLKLTYSTVVGP